MPYIFVPSVLIATFAILLPLFLKMATRRETRNEMLWRQDIARYNDRALGIAAYGTDEQFQQEVQYWTNRGPSSLRDRYWGFYSSRVTRLQSHRVHFAFKRQQQLRLSAVAA